MADLSVLVPSRNEMFLARTIQSVVEAMRGDTEVIAVLDGAWADPPVPQHPKVTVVHLPSSIGQRAATNLAARLSSARYIMKADAHCGFDEGFDVKLIAAAQELGENVVQIPLQFNWHAFDRVCTACGFRIYQGPMNVPCDKCKAEHTYVREMVWQPRRSRKTTAWRFDSTLHFQYWGEFTHRPEGQGEITETMSCLGACWFLSRRYYWDVFGGLDEGHGSWGNMGTELGCKAWLSGGRMVTNHRTWFGHMFRTQGSDFSFPYPIKGSDQERARQYSRDLWLNNKWPGQIHPLSWLIEHFAPVPDWHGAGHERLAEVTEAGHAFTREREARLAVSEVIGTLPNSIADGAAPMPVDGGRQEMTLQAVSAGGALSGETCPAKNVGTVRCEIQMRGITAPLVVAEVIEHRHVPSETDGEITDEPREQQPMNAIPMLVDADDAVSGAGEGARPQPAPSSRVNGDLAEDTSETLTVEVRDCEKMRGNHASTSIVGVRPGAASASTLTVPPSVPAALTKGIIYYSDNRPAPEILAACRRSIEASGLPIVAVTLKPIDWPAARNIVLPLERGYLTMFRQILTGLEALDTDLVFFTEHDVFYSPLHFRFTPPRRDTVYYSQSVWKVDAVTGRTLFYRVNQTSGICADRLLMVEHYRKRIARVEVEGHHRRMGFEPATRKIRHGGIDDLPFETWESPQPNIDIRHGLTLTPNRWRKDQFRNQRYTEGWTESDRVPGWPGITQGRFNEWLHELQAREEVGV